MQFTEYFNYHKIPEWYNMYFNFESLLDRIERFDSSKQENQYVKLYGFYYYIASAKRIVRIRENTVESKVNSDEDFKERESDAVPLLGDLESLGKH